jgi:hypothetical protein
MSDNAVEEDNPKQPAASNPEALLRRSFPRRTINRKSSAGYYPIKPTRPVDSGKPRLAPQSMHAGPIQVVKDDLERASEAWLRYQTTRSRDGVYGFLDTVSRPRRRMQGAARIASATSSAISSRASPNRTSRKFRLPSLSP